MNFGTQGGTDVVRADGISKTFAGLTALEGVSLHLRAGEIVGVIGPNGAGKSTFINVVTGLYGPTSGEVHFLGDDVTKSSLADRARRGLIRSFQHTRTFGSLNVAHALRLAADAPRARAEGVTADEVDATLHDFGLAEWAQREAAVLPYGAQKILNLALVALNRPRALFLDEPFAGVGRHDVERLSAIIDGLRSRGVALAVVEHNIEALLRLADRVTVLESGRTIFDGSPDEARSSSAVRRAYLGDGAAGRRGR